MAAKALNPAAYAFISHYRALCGDKPTPEQTLLIKYFMLAGDNLPVHNDRNWFYVAWRKTEVIEDRHPIASLDMVVWHLIAMCPKVHATVNALLPEFDPYDL
ncbi:hypothetical protein H8U31_001265 [Salmonella enterica]|nr:hypothetical protein [Salmonella enterica]EGC0267515.1 hypothetical protein [Salmonella enterica]